MSNAHGSKIALVFRGKLNNGTIYRANSYSDTNAIAFVYYCEIVIELRNQEMNSTSIIQWSQMQT